MDPLALLASRGRFDVWGVLCEDVYETRFGDGFYLSLRGVALNETDAHRLAALPGESELTRWHVRRFGVKLHDGRAMLEESKRREEEFTLEELISQLAEIEAGGTTSRLLIGSGAEGRRPGPNLLSLD